MDFYQNYNDFSVQNPLIDKYFPHWVVDKPRKGQKSVSIESLDSSRDAHSFCNIPMFTFIFNALAYVFRYQTIDTVGICFTDGGRSSQNKWLNIFTSCFEMCAKPMRIFNGGKVIANKLSYIWQNCAKAKYLNLMVPCFLAMGDTMLSKPPSQITPRLPKFTCINDFANIELQSGFS